MRHVNTAAADDDVNDDDDKFRCVIGSCGFVFNLGRIDRVYSVL